jgi:hypothetical protein
MWRSFFPSERLWASPKFARLTEAQQAMLMRLYACCDRHGRGPADPSMLAHHLHLTRDPTSDVEALVNPGFVKLYEVDGERYYQLVGYDDDAFYDIIRKRGDSAYPALAESTAPQGRPKGAMMTDQGRHEGALTAPQGQGRVEEKRRSLFSETTSLEQQQQSIASPSLGAQASDALRQWSREVLTGAVKASGKRKPWRGSVLEMAEELAGHVTPQVVETSSAWLDGAWAKWRWATPSAFVRELCQRHGMGFDVARWEVST